MAHFQVALFAMALSVTSVDAQTRTITGNPILDHAATRLALAYMCEASLGSKAYQESERDFVTVRSLLGGSSKQAKAELTQIRKYLESNQETNNAKNADPANCTKKYAVLSIGLKKEIEELSKEKQNTTTKK